MKERVQHQWGATEEKQQWDSLSSKALWSDNESMNQSEGTLPANSITYNIHDMYDKSMHVPVNRTTAL